MKANPNPPQISNAEIADRLLSLAQLLAAAGENTFKVKAYRRAARTVRSIGDSLSDLVHEEADLTELPGIGKAISGVIREIVETGTIHRLESLRSGLKPEVAAVADYPNLDARRVQRIYKKMGIGSIPELQEKLASGEIGEKMGIRMEQHVRRALTDVTEILWHEAKPIVSEVQKFLTNRCGAARVEVAGDFRRRLEVLRLLDFVVEANDFATTIDKLQHFGGRTDLLASDANSALMKLPAGILLRIERATKSRWGALLVASTGSSAHLQKLKKHGFDIDQLAKNRTGYPTEEDVYRSFGMDFIPPELREGRDEIRLAVGNKLPELVSAGDIRGELHAHTIASDGSATIEEMAEAAAAKGYDYIGISDHSQSLKIARGLSEEALWEQIREIDRLNGKLFSHGIRILKSTEVDILVDGSLDYPDDLLRQLDYTVCSIHSRFGLGKTEQTERILKAMDSRYFNILGHATGRLLLKRPGYELDFERIVEHAKQNGCYFELNSSPDRLDVSAENARLAREAGVKIAITTDAHSVWDFDYLQYGVDQARRAGFEKTDILNHYTWSRLKSLFHR